MKWPLRIVGLGVALLLAAFLLLAVVLPRTEWGAQDICLDAGGRWNHAEKSCEGAGG